MTIIKAQNQKYFLVGLFCLSFIIRLIFLNLFLADNPCQLMYDSAHYHNPAVSLVQGKGFAVGDKPYFYRLPGYPLFLASCYKVFGLDVRSTLMVQLLLASLIPLLIFFLAQALFPKKTLIAWLAASCAVIHPGLLIFSGLVMTETLFVLFFTFFLLIVYMKKSLVNA